MGYPSFEEEKEIIKRNIQLMGFEEYGIRASARPEDDRDAGGREEGLPEQGDRDYIVQIVDATRKPQIRDRAREVHRVGSVPEASIFLFIAAKANALMRGDLRPPSHIKEVAHNVLRHRIILNYEGSGRT